MGSPPCPDPSVWAVSDDSERKLLPPRGDGRLVSSVHPTMGILLSWLVAGGGRGGAREREGERECAMGGKLPLITVRIHTSYPWLVRDLFDARALQAAHFSCVYIRAFTLECMTPW